MAARVAIIGAGPAGFRNCVHFERARSKGAKTPEIVCFEKQSDWGGLWNYTWRTGLDEYGEPVHGSMYRYLWSNGPKECLEFADYTFDRHFKQPIPSYPAARGALRLHHRPREEERHAQADPLRDAGALRRVFQQDRKIQGHRARTCRTRATQLGEFRLRHRRDRPFLRSERPLFRGRGEISRPRDARATISATRRNSPASACSSSAPATRPRTSRSSATNTGRSTSPCAGAPSRWASIGRRAWTSGRCSTKVDGQDGAFQGRLEPGGRRDHPVHRLPAPFPFLEEKLRLKTRNRLNPPGLYKGVFWEKNPKLMYLGMQDQFYTFSMFDAQAWLARDYVLGRVKLPSRAKMEKETAGWVAREEKLEEPDRADRLPDRLHEGPGEGHRLSEGRPRRLRGDVQGMGAPQGGIDPRLPRPRLPLARATARKAPVHHTPWFKAMDDSMETFLATKAEQFVARMERSEIRDSSLDRRSSGLRSRCRPAPSLLAAAVERYLGRRNAGSA